MNKSKWLPKFFKLSSIDRVLNYFKKQNNISVLEYPYIKTVTYEEIDFKFWITDSIAKKWYNKSILNNDIEITLLAQLLEKGENVLEVGTHYGFHSIFINKICSPLNYVGADIQEKCIMHLQSNLFQNKLFDATIVNAAISENTNSEVSFVPQISGNAWISNDIKKNTKKINTITIDSLSKKLNIDFSFIKIDIEGHELQALKGAQESLKKMPKLALELHGHVLSKESKVEILNLINYTQYRGKIYFRSNNSIENFNYSRILETNEIINLFIYSVI